MRDIAAPLQTWLASHEPVALATVVGVGGSAPRTVGATLAVARSGSVAGSISGGCVEGAVVELARTVLAGGEPELASYGAGEDQTPSVGLTCGGTIDVFVNRVDSQRRDVLATALACLTAGRPVALATLVEGSGPSGALLMVEPGSSAGTLGSPALDAEVADDALAMLHFGAAGLRRYGALSQRRGAEATVFVEAFAAPPRMIVFGAIDFAAATAHMGKFLGYAVTVCDARPVFATRERFPEADEVVVEWPHRYVARTPVDDRTVLCVLTHDPKFDGPLLEAALRTPAAYIGVMGSRRTHEARVSELRERGVSERELARLHAPIGLDLGACTAAETALSIASEIVASQRAATGRPLRDLTGDIHRSEVPV